MQKNYRTFISHKTLSLGKIGLFLLILCIGLYIVKWSPYYHKAFIAAEKQSIGVSILADNYQSLWQATWQYAQGYFGAIWKAAVLGLLLGSLVQVLIPRHWFIRHLGQNRFMSIVLGSMLSLPGMMCTCCAAPVAIGMRRSSASVGAITSFWIGNPILNPATLVFMAFVLGIEFTLLRLGIGILMVLGIGYLTQRYGNEQNFEQLHQRLYQIANEKNHRTLFAQWRSTIWRLFYSTLPVYIVSVLLLSVARVWIFPHTQGVIGDSFFWVIFLSVMGTLFVIPTAAEIPIIQTLQSLGMGTAPALALLFTLPAISLPSLLMMRSVLSVKTLFLITFCVISVGLVVGGMALLLASV